eukprot:6195976-Pleurochrysis_carterae.AAC.2
MAATAESDKSPRPSAVCRSSPFSTASSGGVRRQRDLAVAGAADAMAVRARRMRAAAQSRSHPVPDRLPARMTKF